MPTPPSEHQNRGETPVPPEWRGAIGVAWVMLILAILLLPFAGLITALVGTGLAANHVKAKLALFFVVAGIGVCVLGLAFSPIIDTDSGIDDPENSIPIEFPEAALTV